MSKYHDIQQVAFGKDTLMLTVDGREYTFPLNVISQKLVKATRQERETYEISPSGYGIHWPLLDEDLSIDGLLGVKHHPRSTRIKTAI